MMQCTTRISYYPSLCPPEKLMSSWVFNLILIFSRLGGVWAESTLQWPSAQFSHFHCCALSWYSFMLFWYFMISFSAILIFPDILFFSSDILWYSFHLFWYSLIFFSATLIFLDFLFSYSDVPWYSFLLFIYFLIFFSAILIFSDTIMISSDILFCYSDIPRFFSDILIFFPAILIFPDILSCYSDIPWFSFLLFWYFLIFFSDFLFWYSFLIFWYFIFLAQGLQVWADMHTPVIKCTIFCIFSFKMLFHTVNTFTQDWFIDVRDVFAVFLWFFKKMWSLQCSKKILPELPPSALLLSASPPLIAQHHFWVPWGTSWYFEVHLDTFGYFEVLLANLRYILILLGTLRYFLVLWGTSWYLFCIFRQNLGW